LMVAAASAPPRRDFVMPRRFSWYWLIRLAVISASEVCSPNSARRCFESRSSSARDVFFFLALVWKYRSNASASVMLGTSAGAAGSGYFSASSASCASAREA
jgi:hypothetical protein